MMRIALLGTGNLAIQLVKVFEKHQEVTCVQWIGRKTAPPIDTPKIPYFLEYQHDIQVDICLICVSDDAIELVAEQLHDVDTLVVHTSGAVSINALEPNSRKGVFYPVQSFIKNLIVNWNTIPICVEAESKQDTQMLTSLALLISNEVHEISEKQRLHLHAAAVFANNFCNHLLDVSQKITAKSNVPFSLLNSLIKETFDRSKTHPLSQMQTGPAKRNDLKTQRKHLALLSENEAKIYQNLSQSIFNTYNS